MKFFVFHISYALFSAAVFWALRFCMDACLRAKGKSKTYIKKSKKGLRNYWFFEKAHREIGLGLGYRLNIALLPATLVYSVFVTASCWMPAFQVAAAILSVVLTGLQVPAILWSFIWDNRAEFGTSFILFRRRVHARYFPVCDLLCAVLPIGFAVWNLFFLIDSMGGLPKPAALPCCCAAADKGTRGGRWLFYPRKSKDLIPSRKKDPYFPYPAGQGLSGFFAHIRNAHLYFYAFQVVYAA